MTNVGKRQIIANKKKVGLVCSGGGVKAAAFHMGVAAALRDKGFRFSKGRITDKQDPPSDWKNITTYVGSSGGSIITSMLATGYDIEDITDSYLEKPPNPLRANRKDLRKIKYREIMSLKKPNALKQWDTDYGSGSSLLDDLKIFGGFEATFHKLIKTTGIFSTAGLEQYLKSEVLFSNDFNNYRPDLFITATRLNQGMQVVFGKKTGKSSHDYYYFNQTPVSEAVAASCSLPILFKPYPIFHAEKKKAIYYTDGEVRETLSTHVAVENGCDLIFAAYTHQPYKYHPDVGSLSKYGLTSIIVQCIYNIIERKIISYKLGFERSKRAVALLETLLIEHGVKAEVRTKIIDQIVESLEFHPQTDMLFIHPDPKDYIMFLDEHFSLSPKKMEAVVRRGYRATLNTLRKYKFE